MLPTRFVAVFFAGLMAASLLPGVPTASAAIEGSDLVATELSIDPLVFGREAEVELTVVNQGNQAFTGPFTVFFGFGGIQDQHCIERADPSEGQVIDPCYQQVGGPASTVAANGGSVVVRFAWDIANLWALNNSGAIVITTLIEPGPCTRHTDQGPCQPPLGSTGSPDDNPENNRRDFPKFVKDPKVFAYPVRAVANHTNAKINSPWLPEEVTRDCLDNVVSDAACKAKPGTTVKSRYRVVNVGNAPDTYTPRVSEDAQNGPTALGYTLSWAPESKNVQPNSSAEFELSILVPDDAAAGNSWNVGNAVNLSVAWTSEVNPTIDTSQTRFCPKPNADAGECGPSTILPFVVGRRHALNVTTPLADNFTTVSRGNVSELPLVLRNDGNDADTYAVTFDAERSTIPQAWIISGGLPAPVFVPAGDDASVAIRLSPPADATRGYYTASFLVQSTSTEATTPVRATFRLQMLQWYGLVSQLDNPLVRVVPGEQATYAMSVTNPGNGPENVTLTVQNAPGGWSVALSQPSVTLEAGATAAFFLNVTPPANTPAGAEAAIFVNATSADPADRADLRPAAAPMRATLSVLSGPNADLSASSTSQFVDAGNTTTYTLRVRNVGNEASNFSISAAPSDPNWAVVATPTFLVLNPLGSPNGTAEGDVVVSVRAPLGAQVGETNRVTVTVRPQADDRRAKSTVFEGRISGPDLVASRVDPNATSPYSGDPLKVTIRVSNAGNRQPDKPVTVSLVALKDGAATPIQNVTFAAADLRPGAARDVTMTWDTTGIDGALVLQATIDPDGVVAEIDETNNVATKALTLRTFNLRVLPAEGLSGHPGEKLSYNAAPNVFQVQYLGNQPSEPVRILIESEHGWIAPDQAVVNLDLPRQALIPIRVDVTIPALPGTATDLLTVRVVPALRPDAVVTATATTTVLDDEKPRITAVTAEPSGAKLGENVTVYATVVDATGLASVRANVVTPTHDVVSLLLALQPDGRYAATQPWTQAGTYGITIHAIDASAGANANDTNQILGTFTISPGSAPTIALAPGQTATVRTGSLIKLAISDPLGIAKANYTIRGVTYDLNRSYVIDTSGFTGETLDVAVTAENVYRVPSTARFTFTLDNQPPEIRLVKLTPEKPRAGQDAVVRVETDTRVTAVDVVVKKDGQVLSTLKAVRQSPGVFELTLNPDVGDYAIDVTATDDAGNEKLSERAVTFSSRTDSLIPGPGAWLAALGLAGAALLARRRTG